MIKAPVLRKLCNNDDDYHDKVLCLLSGYYYSKIANTAHDSCMFGVVYSSIQKFTIITIMKPIIFISIYVSIYLDNRTDLHNTHPYTQPHMRTHHTCVHTTHAYTPHMCTHHTCVHTTHAYTQPTTHVYIYT